MRSILVYMTKRIVVNDDGNNSYLDVRPYSRLYAGYDGNTNESTWSTANEWQRFPASSSAWVIWRNTDWSVDEANSRMTYTGSTPRWFSISAVCNVLKASGAAQNRTLLFQWRYNGVPVGFARESQMNNKDSEIVSGNGQLYLTAGDYIEPWWANKENGDHSRAVSCTYDIREDPDQVFIWV